MAYVIAHRGDHGVHPENTLEAFLSALELGVDGLELDIHMSSDGEIVVFHDFDLERLTSGLGPIGACRYKELRALSFKRDLVNSMEGSKYYIPTLESVLELIVEQQPDLPILNVELKAGSAVYPGIEAAVLKLCRQYLRPDQLIFSSFDHEALVAIKDLDPLARIGVLTACVMHEPWVYLSRLGAEFYHPHYLSLRPGQLLGLSDAGIGINPYTVNDLAVAKQLIQGGVYSIITDYPKEVLALL